MAMGIFASFSVPLVYVAGVLANRPVKVVNEVPAVVPDVPAVAHTVAPMVAQTVAQEVGMDNLTRAGLLELYTQCYDNVEKMYAPEMEKRREILRGLMHNEQMMIDYFLTMSDDMDQDKSTCFEKYLRSHEYMESLR